MKIILETPRLLLREFTLEDDAFILDLLNTPAWLRYIGDRGVSNLQQAREYLRNGNLKSYEEHGFGFYMVLLKEGKTPVGSCGLGKREGLDGVDIGFAFLTEFTGLGYGYESASAIMDYARTELKLDRILAITDPANTASQKLLEKIGLRHERMVTLPNDDVELMLYETTF